MPFPNLQSRNKQYPLKEELEETVARAIKSICQSSNNIDKFEVAPVMTFKNLQDLYNKDGVNMLFSVWLDEDSENNIERFKEQYIGLKAWVYDYDITIRLDAQSTYPNAFGLESAQMRLHKVVRDISIALTNLNVEPDTNFITTLESPNWSGNTYEINISNGKEVSIEKGLEPFSPESGWLTAKLTLNLIINIIT